MHLFLFSVSLGNEANKKANVGLCVKLRVLPINYALKSLQQQRLGNLFISLT
jgi:hypothetical protein